MKHHKRRDRRAARAAKMLGLLAPKHQETPQEKYQRQRSDACFDWYLQNFKSKP